ncbi:hypothetical protein SNEBB_001718 [Seison nebaliae]|nr:hypothetical protein SNEBB_001718 [Seison nebaliae]
MDKSSSDIDESENFFSSSEVDIEDRQVERFELRNRRRNRSDDRLEGEEEEDNSLLTVTDDDPNNSPIATTTNEHFLATPTSAISKTNIDYEVQSQIDNRSIASEESAKRFFNRYDKLVKSKYIIIAFVAIILIVVSCMLLARSFMILEYHQFGLLYNNITSSVNTEKVLIGGGHFFTSLHQTIIPYSKTIRMMKRNVQFWTDENLNEMKLSLILLYHYDTDRFGELYRNYGDPETSRLHHDVLSRNFITAVKNQASHFTRDDWLDNRMGCMNTIKRILIKELEKKLFISINNLLLHQVVVDENLKKIFMERTLIKLENEKEQFYQKQISEEKDTLIKTDAILQEKNKVSTLAKVEQSTIVKVNGKTKASIIVSESKMSGTKKLSNMLQIDNNRYLLSLILIRALNDRKYVTQFIYNSTQRNILKKNIVMKQNTYGMEENILSFITTILK